MTMVMPSGMVDFDQESDKYFRRLVLFDGFDKKVFQSGISEENAATRAFCFTQDLSDEG